MGPRSDNRGYVRTSFTDRRSGVFKEPLPLCGRFRILPPGRPAIQLFSLFFTPAVRLPAREQFYGHATCRQTSPGSLPPPGRLSGLAGPARRRISRGTHRGGDLLGAAPSPWGGGGPQKGFPMKLCWRHLQRTLRRLGQAFRPRPPRQGRAWRDGSPVSPAAQRRPAGLFDTLTIADLGDEAGAPGPGGLSQASPGSQGYPQLPLPSAQG